MHRPPMPLLDALDCEPVIAPEFALSVDAPLALLEEGEDELAELEDDASAAAVKDADEDDGVGAASVDEGEVELKLKLKPVAHDENCANWLDEAEKVVAALVDAALLPVNNVAGTPELLAIAEGAVDDELKPGLVLVPLLLRLRV